MSSEPTSATIASQRKYNSDIGFKKCCLLELERMILEKIPSSTIKAKLHIESRIKTLKKEWGFIHDMVQGKDTSGLGWNEQKHMVYAEDAIWDSYLTSHKEATTFRTRSFKFYNELSAIYSKDRATGKDTQTTDDVVEEIQAEEQNDIRVDTDDSAFVVLDDFDFMSTQLISNTMPKVGKNLSDGLQYDHDMDMFQKLDRVLQEVDGLILDEMDLVSLKLTYCNTP
ncbi:uncharacterized protein LOC116013118 [Ipomoea triloba]|uniref:uncharacterized protein LOC116013118 n=1 Tax=Ipomoea triloba TaxID=35885 RepID=UPI00125E26EE|nr:uncharacterized protein LOC116013118 [Ipomoea triloba]